jgi:hypothetical protein
LQLEQDLSVIIELKGGKVFPKVLNGKCRIGKRVVLELSKAGKIFEYPGVLKDYTAEFIEVMDVDYRTKEDQPARKADMVILRKYGIIRHLGE